MLSPFDLRREAPAARIVVQPPLLARFELAERLEQRAVPTERLDHEPPGATLVLEHSLEQPQGDAGASRRHLHCLERLVGELGPNPDHAPLLNRNERLARDVEEAYLNGAHRAPPPCSSSSTANSPYRPTIGTAIGLRLAYTRPAAGRAGSRQVRSPRSLLSEGRLQTSPLVGCLGSVPVGARRSD